MNFKPLHDRIVINPIEEETSKVIIIPDTAKEKPKQGEVIAVGRGKRDDLGIIHSLNVKVGDKVIFPKWAVTEVKIEGNDLFVVKESDIFGIIE